MTRTYPDEQITPSIRLSSPHFPLARARSLIERATPYEPQVHVEFPAELQGNQTIHLEQYFRIAPVVQNPVFVNWIVEGLSNWLRSRTLNPDGIVSPDFNGEQVILDQLQEHYDFRSIFVPMSSESPDLDDVKDQISGLEQIVIYMGSSPYEGSWCRQILPDLVNESGGTLAGSATFALGTSSDRPIHENSPHPAHPTFLIDVDHHETGSCPESSPPVQNRTDLESNNL